MNKNYTYENIETQETAMIFPTFVIYNNEVYQFIDNKGQLMTIEYLQDHYKKVEV